MQKKVPQQLQVCQSGFLRCRQAVARDSYKWVSYKKLWKILICFSSFNFNKYHNIGTPSYLDIFWIAVGGGGCIFAVGGWWWMYFGWQWVVVDSGGWWWIFWLVVGGGGWCHSLV